MNHNWNTLIQNGGDENLGQALIRLARQAVAVHQFQAHEDRLAPSATIGAAISQGRGVEAVDGAAGVGVAGEIESGGEDWEVRR